MTVYKPKLWIVSELFYPEQTSTGYFLTEIARGLAHDCDVHVLCGQPTYSERGIRAPRHEMWQGMSIRRLRATAFNKDRLALRAINTLTLTVSAFFFLLFHWRRGDKALVVTNPPSFTLIAAFVAQMKGVEAHLLVHDVYPEILAAAGMLSKRALLYRLVEESMARAYRAFTSVIVLGRDMQCLIAEKMGVLPQAIAIIPNWGDVDEVMPLADAENPFTQQHGLLGKTVIQFSGNIGRTHDVESLLKAVQLLHDRSDIQFVIAGFGGKAAIIRQAIQHGSMANLRFLDRQPRDMLGPMLSSATAVVIAFNAEMLGLSVPSRMYNVMAAGTPIIAMADPDSELAQCVEVNQIGWVIAPHDATALTNLIEWLATSEGKEAAQICGLRARKLVEAQYSLQHVLECYRSHLLLDHHSQ